jgi:hypothetical protein
VLAALPEDTAHDLASVAPGRLPPRRNAFQRSWVDGTGRKMLRGTGKVNAVYAAIGEYKVQDCH